MGYKEATLRALIRRPQPKWLERVGKGLAVDCDWEAQFLVAGGGRFSLYGLGRGYPDEEGRTYLAEEVLAWSRAPLSIRVLRPSAFYAERNKQPEAAVPDEAEAGEDILGYCPVVDGARVPNSCVKLSSWARNILVRVPDVMLVQKRDASGRVVRDHEGVEFYQPFYWDELPATPDRTWQASWVVGERSRVRVPSTMVDVGRVRAVRRAMKDLVGGQGLAYERARRMAARGRP